MTLFSIENLIIGNSAAIQRLRSLVLRLAPARIPVLIQGPTGSGKELVARSLHLARGRQAPFVAFNVAAVAESLFESALFGHVRGAFSGAVANAPGYLEQANGGTCFLDEVGSLSLTAQSKLLRVLEDGVFRPVGAGTDRRSDFRLVSATNESIMDAARAAHFRSDLAYRLCGAIVDVPPLREHRDDIPLLAQHFLDECEPAKVSQLKFTKPALDLLCSWDWPGNVRELKHAVERVTILTTGTTIDADSVRDTLTGAGAADAASSIREDDEELLRRVLEAENWNRTSAARRLALHPITVYRRMKRLGIVPPTDGVETAPQT